MADDIANSRRRGWVFHEPVNQKETVLDFQLFNLGFSHRF
jgi:hypothetical protein